MTEEVKKAVVTLLNEPEYKTLNLLISATRFLNVFCDGTNSPKIKDMADLLNLLSESEKKQTP